MGGKRWTPAELHALERYYGRVPSADLAEKLGRTVNAIQMKASELGITGKRDD